MKQPNGRRLKQICIPKSDTGAQQVLKPTLRDRIAALKLTHKEKENCHV